MNKDSVLIKRNINSRSRDILKNTRRKFLEKYNTHSLINEHDELSCKNFKDTDTSPM